MRKLKQVSLQMISAAEKYYFDLNGYLVIRGVFSQPCIEEMNAVVDRRIHEAKERPPDIRNSRPNTALSGDGITGRKDMGKILEWGEVDSHHFRSVLDHPTLIPYYHAFMGKGYRMDHNPFIILQDKGSEGFHLHGGTVDVSTGQYSPEVAYSCHQGRIHNPLMGVSVALSDCNAGDGGFIAVRGSHKANFAAPADMIDGMGVGSEFITQPVMRAGDVLMFSEGTAHGARPWTAEHQRRVALYRFSPATSCYGRSYYPGWSQAVSMWCTDSQRAVLEPPYACRLDRPIQQGEGNIEISTRSENKKSFDKEVFGGYF